MNIIKCSNIITKHIEKIVLSVKKSEIMFQKVNKS